jgi:hypothetical protein
MLPGRRGTLDAESGLTKVVIGESLVALWNQENVDQFLANVRRQKYRVKGATFRPWRAMNRLVRTSATFSMGWFWIQRRAIVMTSAA